MTIGEEQMMNTVDHSIGGCDMLVKIETKATPKQAIGRAGARAGAMLFAKCMSPGRENEDRCASDWTCARGRAQQVSDGLMVGKHRAGRRDCETARRREDGDNKALDGRPATSANEPKFQAWRRRQTDED